MPRLALLLLLLPACYTYQPLAYRPGAGVEPAPGRRVSVELTADGARALAAAIGPDIRQVDGDVLQADSSGLALAVQQVENDRGVRSDWNGERVTLPRSSIAGLQERRLSVGGSVLMGGLALAGVYAIYSLVGGDDLFGGSGGRSGGGSQQ